MVVSAPQAEALGATVNLLKAKGSHEVLSDRG